MDRRFKPLKKRFWNKVNKDGPLILETKCWVWFGAITGRDGNYGGIRINRRKIYSHIASYEMKNGPVPNGLVLDHLCKNTFCVNPDHLEPVTNRINILRGIGPTAVNARKTHCIRGHELSPKNIYVTKNGGRQCNPCRRFNYKRKMAQRNPGP